MKIVVLDGYGLNPGDLSWDGIKAFGEAVIYDRTPVDKIVERIGDAEVVVTNKTPLNGDIFDKCPGVKFIGVLATGFNVVDVKSAREHGITVSNVPTYATKAVAQFVLAMILEFAHHIGAHSHSVKKGDWTSSIDFCYWKYPMFELENKTLGLIGYGRIGRETALLAKAFGMKTLVYTPHPKEDECAQFVGIDELYAKSDFISLHCPLTESTKGLINKESISKMKDGAYLINTSRGPVIEEQDLADALNSSKLSGAAVDVVSVEPIRADNPLLTAKNCLITPHIAWAPMEARIRLMDISVENLKAYVNGAPINVVN